MSSKKFYAVSFFGFLLVLAMITVIIPLQSQRMVAKTVYLPVIIETTKVSVVKLKKQPNPVVIEKNIFFQLSMDIFRTYKSPKERLRAINVLKAVSAHYYLANFDDPKMVTALRAAAYQGRKKAEKEFGIKL